MTIFTGRIDYYNASKGWGFIKSSDERIKHNYFFHFTKCLYENIREGDKIKFQLVDNPRKENGKMAIEIEIDDNG
jgi:cold shock CspA family protein